MSGQDVENEICYSLPVLASIVLYVFVTGIILGLLGVGGCCLYWCCRFRFKQNRAQNQIDIENPLVGGLDDEHEPHDDNHHHHENEPDITRGLPRSRYILVRERETYV